MKLSTSLSLAIASLFIASAAFAGDCACSKKEGEAHKSCAAQGHNCQGSKDCSCDKAEHHHKHTEKKHEHKEAKASHSAKSSSGAAHEGAK